MPLALRGDSFHIASFSPTISIVQMYPAYRLRRVYQPNGQILREINTTVEVGPDKAIRAGP